MSTAPHWATAGSKRTIFHAQRDQEEGVPELSSDMYIVHSGARSSLNVTDQPHLFHPGLSQVIDNRRDLFNPQNTFRDLDPLPLVSG